MSANIGWSASIDCSSLIVEAASMVRASIIRVLPGPQVDRAVNVDALTPTRLLDRKLLLARRPAAGRPRGMGRMHGVRKQHGLVVPWRIQQLFVALNESLLLFFVELARDDIGLVIFEAQAMQQCDQSLERASS